MKLVFKRIIISNFMSFGNAEIDFNSTGFVLVRGVNQNESDLATSNGSGKSSIWEAISWALTGETIRGCKNVTNINGNDGALVELSFLVDNDEYVITRTKDHSKFKSSLKIVINGQDKSGKGIRDSEKLLSQYLPDLTSELIGSVIILGQGLPQKFSNNTPSGRKDVLEKLSRSDFMIEDIKNRVNDRTTAFNSEKKLHEDELIKLNTELGMYKSNLINTQNRLDSIGDAVHLTIAVDDIKGEIESVTNKIEDIGAELPKAKSNLDFYTNRISELVEKEKNEIESIKNDYSSINELKDEANEIRIEMVSLNNLINEKESITDVCPTCGQKLVGVKKPDTTADKEHYKELSKSHSEIMSKVCDLEKEYNSKIEEVSNRYKSDRNTAQVQINVYNNDVANYNDLLNTLNRKLIELNQNLSEQENKLFNFNTTKQQLIDTIKTINDNISEIDNKILYNNNELNNLNAHLEVLNKMSTYIKRDFRGYLLTNVINYLDKKSKQYCMDIFNHSNINFELDGNNISININNKEYEQLSGGERQKVDLIIQLAIRDMLCKYSNFSSNIFVLDEIFDNLDEVGSEKVLTMLTKRLEDVSIIFIVTHHASISIPVDRQLIVIKDSTGISRIEG